MAHLKAMVRLAMVSGITEDSPVNTFHFDALLTPDPYPEILAALTSGYNDFRSSFANTVAQNGHSLKVYNMGDPEPRAPQLDTTFNLTSAPSGNPLPSEVAICCSFQGDRVSGTSQARRRGRVYLGPLNTSASDSNGRVSTAARDNTLNFGQAIGLALPGLPEVAWCVFSTVDDELVPITNGWTDNSFDTQRRRGLAPTTRSTFTIP